MNGSMFRLGMPELVIILLIIFFLFGAKRLPEMVKGITQGVHRYKRETQSQRASQFDYVIVAVFLTLWVLLAWWGGLIK